MSGTATYLTPHSIARGASPLVPTLYLPVFFAPGCGPPLLSHFLSGDGWVWWDGKPVSGEEKVGMRD